MSTSIIQDKTNIKKSLKVTSLFGGVEIFGVLISIIRNKCIALLIGPIGIGLVELYNSTIRLITKATDFSIRISAVRDISVAYKSGNQTAFSHLVAVFSKLVWFTGILGTVICILGSPLWSKFTFGDYSHSWGFILLSCVLLLTQLQNGKNVLLQSTEHYKYLAYSGLIGNVLGLFTTVPIYYLYGVDGVIPVLIITALISFCLVYYYSNKIEIKKTSISNNEAMKDGRHMLKQGFLLSINYLLSALVFYILRIFISNKGGVEEVGLYSASFAIVSTYVGLVFQSMTQEYYPRLSTLSSDNKSMNNAINDQIYFTLLMLGPLVAFFLTCSDFLLQLLYSSKFTRASMLMTISMVGVLFQGPSWCIAYALLAKGDNKVYLIYETISKLIKLLFEICFYLLWGLTGLGIAFFLSYLYYTIQCTYVCKYRYGYKMGYMNMILLFSYFCISLILVYTFVELSLLLRLCLGFAVVLCASLFSYYKLNQILDIKAFVKNKILKK